MNQAAKTYAPRGNVRELFDWIDGLAKPPREVLVEGPAGTGKSRAVGEFLYECGTKWPSTKILALRRFRADLHKGFQRTWEDMVLYPGHDLLRRPGGGKGANRESYNWDNGSSLVLGHMEDPQRWYSSEWDIIYWNEVNEARLDQWERLFRSLRKGDRPTQCPWRLLMGDTNPDAPKHWANMRCKRGEMHRVTTIHKDNPSLEPEYLERLRKLTGVRYRRLYLGEWSAAEGQIWDCFDEQVHVVDQTPELKWYMAGLDFGYRNPGCLLVCGFDEHGTGYVVSEVYRSGRHLEWWADQILELHAKTPMSMIVADSAEPRSIDWLNERLGLASSDGSAFVQPVQKRKTQGKSWGFASREHVRSLWQQRVLYVLDDVQRLVGGPDPDLVGVPRCLTDEIGEYVYRTAPEGRELQTAQREDPDPTCADHACDALIYLASQAWALDFTPPVPDDGLPKFTMGELLNHAEVWGDSDPTDGMESTFEDWKERGAFSRPRY